MAATGHDFPNITPSRRSYTPGTYPTREFQGLNGAVTTLQYGTHLVDSKLEMTFENIPDAKAWEIFEHYEAVNGGRDNETDERDYIVFNPATQPNALAGIGYESLRKQIGEQFVDKLRYRYASPPTITSVFPNVSTVTVELRGYLEI